MQERRLGTNMTVEMLNDTPQSLCPNCIHAELYNGRTDGEITHQLLKCQVMIHGRQRCDCEYYETKKKEKRGG